MEEQKLTKSYADAWSENQGSYSEGLAKKIHNFIKLQNLNINSALDVCCGSANFLNELQKYGIACTGTEILDSYVDYNKEKFPNMRFIKTNDILDFDQTGKYDLISCNHDVVNMLPTLDDWNTFFAKAYKHLNNGGILLFDYYSKKKLKDWNEVIFDESDKLDYVKEIKTIDSNHLTFTNIFYSNIDYDPTKNADAYVHDRDYSFNEYNKYKRNVYKTDEYYFDNEEIFSLIKKCGYRYLITTDGSLSPISNVNEMNRVHIIAIKREG